MHPNAHSSTVNKSQDMEAIQALMDGYRRHTRTPILAIKKNRILPLATMQMGPENIMLGEISQTMINTVYRLYVKSRKHKWMCVGGGEQPHTGNKLAAYQRGEGKGRGKWEEPEQETQTATYEVGRK